MVLGRQSVDAGIDAASSRSGFLGMGKVIGILIIIVDGMDIGGVAVVGLASPSSVVVVDLMVVCVSSSLISQQIAARSTGLCWL